MALSINTNLAATMARNQLGINNNNLDKSLVRLSSGLRINSAADDAAGLTIAEKFRSQTLGLDMAAQNSQDGINLLRTAEGALGESTSILQRMRELAVQGANDTLTASDRLQISSELDQLSSEIDRIASATQFNTVALLNGGAVSSSGLTLQIGANAGQVLNVKIDTASAQAFGVLTTQISVDSAANACTTIANIDSALVKVSSQRSKMGATINRLEHTITNLNVQASNMAASESRIRDVDVSRETSALIRNQILAQASQAMLSQANQAPQSALQLLK